MPGSVSGLAAVVEKTSLDWKGCNCGCDTDTVTIGGHTFSRLRTLVRAHGTDFVAIRNGYEVFRDHSSSVTLLQGKLIGRCLLEDADQIVIDAVIPMLEKDRKSVQDGFDVVTAFLNRTQ